MTSEYEPKRFSHFLAAFLFFEEASSTFYIFPPFQVSKGGVHGFIHTAPAKEPLIQASKYVRSRGTIIMLSLPKDTPIAIDSVDVVIRALTIRGSYVGNRIDTDEAIGFFARGQIQSIIQLRGLSQLPQIFEEMSNGTLIGRVVVNTKK